MSVCLSVTAIYIYVFPVLSVTAVNISVIPLLRGFYYFLVYVLQIVTKLFVFGYTRCTEFSMTDLWMKVIGQTSLKLWRYLFVIYILRTLFRQKGLFTAFCFLHNFGHTSDVLFWFWHILETVNLKSTGLNSKLTEMQFIAAIFLVKVYDSCKSICRSYKQLISQWTLKKAVF